MNEPTTISAIRRPAILLRTGGALLLALAIVAPQLSLTANGQGRPSEAAPSPGFVTPFPEADTYKVVVYGDAFAEGLAPALAEVLGGDQRLAINRKFRAIGALVRSDWEDEIKTEEANRDTVHIAIIMIGVSDRQSIRSGSGGKSLSTGSDEWRDEYGRRFERLVRTIKKRNTAVYVIGQPVLRSSTQNNYAEMLSDVMSQRAAATGAKFIDISETFQEDGGGFSQFGPDISGNRVKLREGDGVMLTSQGQRKLAHFVERELKRDIDQAASDRAIPLAGDDVEQKRINPHKGGAASGGWRGQVTVAGRANVQSQVPVAPVVDSSGDQKADNGRITVKSISASGREEATTIEILRPAIPAAVVALLTRRESSRDRGAQPGEAVVEDVGGGLTVVNSVSMLGDGVAVAGGSKRRPGSTQSAYFRVLIKGERMEAKPGRADDFTWPRPDPFLAVAPAAAQVRQTSGARQAPAPRNMPAPKSR